MNHNLDLTNEEFAFQFKEGVFPPELFTHEAHLRLAWIYITAHGVEKAIELVCSQVKAFVIIANAESKYNHTLTIAAVKIVNHFIQKSNTTTFPRFVEEFPRLKTNFRNLIEAHYSVGACFSDLAQKEFVEPDLLGFN